MIWVTVGPKASQLGSVLAWKMTPHLPTNQV